MAVMFDPSARSIVVFCTDCIYWSDIVTTARAAERLALAHTMDVHPGDEGKITRDKLAKRRERLNAAVASVG